MSMNDLLADLLTRVRNAHMAKHESTDVIFSRMNQSIAEILKEEGYIKNVKVIKDGKTYGVLRLYLKYDDQGKPVISGLRRESKPGLRKYVGADQIPPILNGLGIAVLSTSKGVITGEQARKLNVGGEFLCSVW
ncbi:MAG: 30S ribosomal protein S8 [Deltaproteobacteria bacterium]|nr:30S ribosomal protein S8 [Candidatus Anaeroferrophillus wilburensis]MBN2889534.1 30S ribosomal protein S8 [Deltaproteobacteria bacterium]